MNSLCCNLTFIEIFQFCSIFLAFTTCIYAIKTFIRNRKQELENHLFKIKIEALSNLTFEMDNFFIILNRTIVKLSLINKINNLEERYSKTMELSLETDEQLYKCHSMIAKYSVFFSNKSIQSLLNFSSNIIGQFENEDNEQDDILISYYQNQLKFADIANNTLREELKLEKLHNSLHLRYK